MSDPHRIETLEQLREVFDEDLWRSARPGQDEAFDAARFVVWLEVLLEAGEELVVESRMDDGGAVFGDGIESDAVDFPWGARVRLSVAARRLRLVSA